MTIVLQEPITIMAVTFKAETVNKVEITVTNNGKVVPTSEELPTPSDREEVRISSHKKIVTFYFSITQLHTVCFIIIFFKFSCPRKTFCLKMWSETQWPLSSIRRMQKRASGFPNWRSMSAERVSRSFLFFFQSKILSIDINSDFTLLVPEVTETGIVTSTTLPRGNFCASYLKHILVQLPESLISLFTATTPGVLTTTQTPVSTVSTAAPTATRMCFILCRVITHINIKSAVRKFFEW